MSSNELEGLRRSSRSVKVRRSYSPEPVLSNPAPKGSAQKKTKFLKQNRLKTEIRDPQNTGKAEREKFSCDRCKSSFVVPLHRRISDHLRRPAYPRHYKDPETNKISTLCNACGLATKQKQKKNKPQLAPSPDEKEKYIQNARLFANSLVEALKDQDAERLYCPEFRLRPCACLQKFVIGGGEWSELTKRAQLLLYLLKEAKSLSRQKYYKLDEVISLNKNKRGKRLRHIGLGNGQKRSAAFEEFVLMQRKYLREELGICERATQKVLLYSNNFLHKKLKTEPEKTRRVQRKKGKAALGLLKPIEELVMESCCQENCVLMANTHMVLLKYWRDRASLGQAETRRVLAEMLTPSAGKQQNCYKFISLVTGCSNSTISRVSEQMRQTGGDREPPEHGLKRFWQEQAKKQSVKSKNLPNMSPQMNESMETPCQKDGNVGPFLESLMDSPADSGVQHSSVVANVRLEGMHSSNEHMIELRQQVAQFEKEQFFQQAFVPTTASSRESGSISEQEYEGAAENHLFEMPVTTTTLEPTSNVESAGLSRIDQESSVGNSSSSSSSASVVKSSNDSYTLNLMHQPVHQIILNGVNNEPVTVQVVNSGLGSVLLIRSLQKEGNVIIDKNACSVLKESAPLMMHSTEISDSSGSLSFDKHAETSCLLTLRQAPNNPNVSIYNEDETGDLTLSTLENETPLHSNMEAPLL